MTTFVLRFSDSRGGLAANRRQKIFGPENQETLLAMQSLGAVYVRLGKYENALEFLIKALAGLEKVLAPEHEDIMCTLV